MERRARHQVVVAGTELLFGLLLWFVDKSAQPIGFSRTEHAASPTFEELAAQQGVTPVDDFETLLGRPFPEDESAEEFSTSLREWRREGTRPGNPQ